MTNRAFTISDIDRAIAAENERHDAAIAKLQAARETFAELGDLLAPQGTKPVRKTAPRIVYDSAEYGAKKLLFLRLIEAEEDGLSSTEMLAAAQKAGLPDAKIENITPYLSTLKSDLLLTMYGNNWCITEKGRNLLSEKN